LPVKPKTYPGHEHEPGVKLDFATRNRFFSDAAWSEFQKLTNRAIKNDCSFIQRSIAMLLDTPAVEIGWKAPSFTLSDPDGKPYSLERLAGSNGLLIAFICNHCPYVQAIADRLSADAKILIQENIGVVAINSNDYRSVTADSPPMMKKFSAQHDFTFPYLVDEDQLVGRTYGAVCTPDFFGFNSSGELQYRGRLDDANMGDPSNRKTELLDAMQQIASTGIGPAEQNASMGCSIKWS